MRTGQLLFALIAATILAGGTARADMTESDEVYIKRTALDQLDAYWAKCGSSWFIAYSCDEIPARE